MAFKILLPMKRKPGMSVEAFRDYYENRHVPLVLKYGAGMSRYVRRYLEPQAHPENGPAGELPWDVLTEIWFEDEAVYRRTLAYLTTTVMPEEVVEDEKQLFDRGSFRIVTVEERETDLGGAGTATGGGT